MLEEPDVRFDDIVSEPACTTFILQNRLFKALLGNRKPAQEFLRQIKCTWIELLRSPLPKQWVRKACIRIIDDTYRIKPIRMPRN